MGCRTKNLNGLSVSHATQTRHAKRDRELSRWSSIQSATLDNNFYVITSQGDTSSEHLIADQESFHSEYLELIEDEIEEDGEEKESGEEDGEEEEAEREEGIEDLGNDSYNLA